MYIPSSVTILSFFAALSSVAARRQVEEDRERFNIETDENFCDAEDDEETQSTPIFSRPSTSSFVPTSTVQTVTADSAKPSAPCANTVSDSLATLQNKLQWCTEKLRQSDSPDTCIQWCKVVQQCAESMSSLYSLQSRIQKSS